MWIKCTLRFQQLNKTKHDLVLINASVVRVCVCECGEREIERDC